MNVLIDDLPESVFLTDPDPPYLEHEYPINSDFRAGVKFSILMENPDIDENEKLVNAIEIYYGAIPTQIEGAYEALICFYTCGNDQPGDGQNNTTGRCSGPLFSYEQDAPYIYAAFQQAYGIDLTTAKMHWWKFQALFNALPDDTMFMKILSYRAWEPYDGCPKDERRRMRKLQRQFAIKTGGAARANKQADDLQKALESGDMTSYMAKYHSDSNNDSTGNDSTENDD